MFERFTDRARAVIVVAQNESRDMFHDFIGCEHLLLGLIAQKNDALAGIFAANGVTSDIVRAAIREAVIPGRQKMTGHIPFQPNAKRSLELALRASKVMGHNYIGVEHLLIGILDERSHADKPDVACVILGDIIARDEPTGSAEAALDWLRSEVVGSFTTSDFHGRRFELDLVVPQSVSDLQADIESFLFWFEDNMLPMVGDDHPALGLYMHLKQHSALPT